MIRRVPYGDTSLICHFFTEQHGRIALMAKGARRPKSPFRASLEPLYALEIAWRPGRSGMGTLTDAHRGHALVSPARMLEGQELLAIISRLFQEGDPHGYAELLAALQMLDAGEEQALPAALWQLLDQAGWLGDLNHCWHCGAEAREVMYWRGGHLLCGECGRGMEISAGLRKSMQAVQSGGHIRFSQRDDHTWREMIRSVLQQHGIKLTDSFRA